MADEDSLPAGVNREPPSRWPTRRPGEPSWNVSVSNGSTSGSIGSLARMPVAENTQVYGQLHGGATAIESVGSFGTAVVAGMDKTVVGIHLSVNHLRAVRDG